MVSAWRIITAWQAGRLSGSSMRREAIRCFLADVAQRFRKTRIMAIRPNQESSKFIAGRWAVGNAVKTESLPRGTQIDALKNERELGGAQLQPRGFRAHQGGWQLETPELEALIPN